MRHFSFWNTKYPKVREGTLLKTFTKVKFKKITILSFPFISFNKPNFQI